MRVPGLSKFSILLLAIVASLLIVATPAVSAHVLKQDQGISGVLHIPPEDNPPASSPVKLNISFADTKSAFNLSHCVCQIDIQLNGKTSQTISLKPFSPGSTLTATATVEFPEVGVYDVIARGTPQPGSTLSFPSFRLNYLVRVAGTTSGTTSNTAKGSSVLIIAAGSLAILALFATVAITHGPRYKPKPKKH